jgi:hypothetical protein
MEDQPMTVVLSPHGGELLRAARSRHPEKSAAEIIEEALTDRSARELESSASQPRTPGEIRAWLDELASLSDKTRPMPGETFSREMVYQEHD